MGGSCGCCSCGCCTREVDREFYTYMLMSADATIKHWEAAVEAGKSILWDSLSEAMEEIASEVIEEYGKTLEKTERILIAALDDQFDRIKTDRESVVTEAQQFQQGLKAESEGFSNMQRDILSNKPEAESG